MPPPAEPTSRARRAGRYVVYATFALLLCHLIGMVLTSVLLSLYGRPPASAGGGLDAAQRDWCVRAVVTLRDELEHEVEVALRVPPRGDPRARFDGWDARWMQRQGDAASRCGDNAGLTKAHERLVTLHDAYVSAVRSLLAARTDVAPSLADVVQVLQGGQKTPP